MNPFIKELFDNSEQTDASATVSAEDIFGGVYDVLEKEAQAQGIDLESSFTEDEIVEIIQEHISEEGGLEKVAHNMGAVLDTDVVEEQTDDLEKVASAFGAIAAESFRATLNSEDTSGPEQVTMEKLAHYEEEGTLGEYLEDVAGQRAHALLGMAHDSAQEAMHFMDSATQEDLEKVAALEELEDALAGRALEILEEHGYDVDAVLGAIDG